MLIKQRIASIDFETRSEVNLIKHGTYHYAYDDSTDIVCCSFLLPDAEEPLVWLPPWVNKLIPEHKNPKLDELFACDKFQAWNANFDRHAWYVCTDLYGWPDLEIEDWICTAAMARSNGLPGKLENAARCLGLAMQKDRRGTELIAEICVPPFNEDPKLLREMAFQYCPQDVRTEHAVAETLRKFLPHELQEYQVSERINDRGVVVDLNFCEKAVQYSEKEMYVLEEELQAITKGEVERPKQYQRIKDWLLDKERLSEDAIKLMEVYKQGEKKISLDKNIRINLLTYADENPGEIDPDAEEVIHLTDLAGRSTTAKYKTLLARSFEGRYRGAYLFSGAPSTGRYSSLGVQIHNLLRDCVDDFDAALKSLSRGTDAEIIHTLSRMIRPTFRAADGKLLGWSDWSNVEGRALPWLAGTRAAQKKIDLFVHCDNHPKDPDVYEQMARSMGLDDRQIGKVVELSMGYGGGIGAGQAMARNYGVRVTDMQMKRYRDLWRKSNPWAEPFWYALRDAAWDAMNDPDGDGFHRAGRVGYYYTERTHAGKGTLWCQLPSGRLLAYVNPRFENVPCPWDETQTMVELTCIKPNFLPKADEKEWPRIKLWYGVLAENITQATCADILRDTLVEAEKRGLKVVMHTHDEVVIEMPMYKDKTAVENGQLGTLVALMESEPNWAAGLPLRADMHYGPRYTK